MFKFLKDKIKDAVSNIAKKVEEPSEEAPQEVKEDVQEAEEQPQEEAVKEGPVEEEKVLEEAPEAEEPKEEKQGFFSRLFHKKKEEETVEEKEVEPVEEKGEEEDVDAIESPRDSGLELDIEEREEKPEQKEEPEEKTTEEEPASEEEKKEDSEEREESIQEEEKKETEEVKEEPVEEKKGIFSKLKQKILTTTISKDKFEDLFLDLEIALLENNVAMEVIDKIKDDLKENLVGKPVKRGDVSTIVLESLKNSISEILSFESISLEKRVKQKKPFIICFVGVNGSGKTTTIAKVAKMLQEKKLQCVMAAADTFRAAAIEQLEEHANKLGIKIIKHNYGSDSAAVAFDAIKHAEAKNIDVVLIDTAGRLHSNKGLIDELKKLKRVAKPDLTIFVGESITGNDCVEQAKQFNEEIGVDAIILTKADVDEKGGAALSVSYITKKPILFLGMGQGYDSLEAFNKDKILKNLGF